MRFFAVFLLLAGLISCVETAAPPTPPPDPAAVLQAIPDASPEKSRNVRDVKDWKNPYLMVREDGIGLLDLANHEIHILKPDEVPAALANLPASAWPYGRVVVVVENGSRSGTEESKVRMRKNRALLAGTLASLKVAINWVPGA